MHTVAMERGHLWLEQGGHEEGMIGELDAFNTASSA
jgi:hypothetical protein